jgi:hypothetical protein
MRVFQRYISVFEIEISNIYKKQINVHREKVKVYIFINVRAAPFYRSIFSIKRFFFNLIKI